MARNDYEDAQLLLHVPLGVPATLVTNDSKLRAAIERAVRLAKQLDDFPAINIEVRSVADVDALPRSATRLRG